MKWLTIILAVALVITVAVLWQKCDGTNSTEKAKIANYQASLDSSKAIANASRANVDSLAKILHIHDSMSNHSTDSLLAILNSQKTILLATKKQLQNQAGQIQVLIDTSGNLALKASYDSLLTELSHAYEVVGQYSNSSDTTIITMAAELNYKDSIITVLQGEIVRLQAALDKTNALAESLLTDAKHAAKKSAIAAFFSKIRTELEIAAALIIAYLTLIK